MNDVDKFYDHNGWGGIEDFANKERIIVYNDFKIRKLLFGFIISIITILT